MFERGVPPGAAALCSLLCQSRQKRLAERIAACLDGRVAQVDWRSLLGAVGLVSGVGGLAYYVVRKEQEHEAELVAELTALRQRELEEQQALLLEQFRGMVRREVDTAVDARMRDVDRRHEERERGRDLRAQVREQERDKRAAANDAERDRRNRLAEAERDRRNRAAEAERERRAKETETARATTASDAFAQQQREILQRFDNLIAEHEQKFQERLAQIEQLLARTAPQPLPSGTPGSVNDRIRRFYDD